MIAQEYGINTKTLVALANMHEFNVLRREISRDLDEAANFKKALYAYNHQVSRI
jgi:hypothetical protein